MPQTTTSPPWASAGLTAVGAPTVAAGSTVLTVGVGKEFATVAAAVAAAHDGDTVLIDAGTYTNDFATVTSKITIEGVGGMVDLVATVPPPNDKGILLVDDDVTIANVSFSGAAITAALGGDAAGIRYEGGQMTLENDSFTGNQNGILAAPVIAALTTNTISIDHCSFDGNGVGGDGHTHNIYVSSYGSALISQLTVTNTLSEGALTGHELKSRAAATTIEDSIFRDGASGTSSYEIDLPDGGDAVVTGNLLEKGPNAGNPALLHFGGESPIYAGSALTATGNSFVNDYAGNAVGILNQTSVGVTVNGNAFTSFGVNDLLSGPGGGVGNTDDGAPDPLCFAKGTRIRTSRGDVPVERLRVGDLLVTADGRCRPARWIGRRALDLTRYPDRTRAAPVRIAAGAIADGAPARDLLVSPAHAIFFNGTLIPARALLNGLTVTQRTDATRVTYFHVELDTHDIIVAEGVPTESYLDTGGRAAFESAERVVTLFPDFAAAPSRAYTEHCAAPLEVVGRRVDALRRVLACLPRAHSSGARACRKSAR